MAALLLAAADVGNQLAGDTYFAGGVTDETAHLLTALFILWALGGAALRRLGPPVLIASVAIDLDHIPQALGSMAISAGTPRPYPHSLLTVALVAGLALFWPRRREVLIGVALGLVIHLWRDVAEAGSGVALLWPFSTASIGLPHATYLAVMAAVIAAVAVRAWRMPAR